MDPDALCAFVDPVDASRSETFYCRTTINQLNGLWWIGHAEIIIPLPQMQELQKKNASGHFFPMLVRFEARGFAGMAHVIKSAVEGDIVTVFFVGLTAVEAAC